MRDRTISFLPVCWGTLRSRKAPEESTIFVVARTFGNALHQLQAFVQPHVKHVIMQTFEQADEEFLGDKSDTAVHLLRQAIRIQRGDEVDQISALLPRRRLAMQE
jgi:hypothetical protein